MNKAPAKPDDKKNKSPKTDQIAALRIAQADERERRNRAAKKELKNG